MCYIGYILDRFHGIKRCTKCGHVRKHNRDKAKKDGLHSKCVTCVKQYKKEHYTANRDAIRAYQKEHYKENRDVRLAYQKEYHEEHRDAIRAQKKEYNSKPEKRQKINARQRDRRATDPAYRARVYLGVALNKFLKGSKNGRRTLDIVGCTPQELIEYLDQTMSPETRAALEAGKKIEVDHIIPQHAPGIDIMNDAHVRAIYHYTNLQWLDGPTNGTKSNNVPEGFDTETWLVEQQTRIEACRGMRPVDTITMNAKMLADARTFANSFRR